jgi:thymidylate kinase
MKILIEGVDGAGKTSLALNIHHKLKEKGFTSSYLKFPTKQGLSTKDDFINDFQEASYGSGKFTIIDRHYPSTIIYQNLRFDLRAELNKDGIILPKFDFIFHVRVDSIIAYSRILERAEELALKSGGKPQDYIDKVETFKNLTYNSLQYSRLMDYLRDSGENVIDIKDSMTLEDKANFVMNHIFEVNLDV